MKTRKNRLEYIKTQDIKQIAIECFGDKLIDISQTESNIYVWLNGCYIKIRNNLINPKNVNCDVVGALSYMTCINITLFMSKLNKM